MQATVSTSQLFTERAKCVQKSIEQIKDAIMNKDFSTFAELTMKVGMVNVLKFCTPKLPIKWHMQIVQTQIRLLLKEQSDQGLHYLPFH